MIVLVLLHHYIYILVYKDKVNSVEEGIFYAGE